MFKFKAKQAFTKDIGIDLGTATVLVYVQGKGIVLNEPSVVAVNTDTDMITKVGKEAQAMIGRTPENIKVVRPLENGVISQYEVTQKMIQFFIRRACGGAVFPPRVMICIPTGITEVEERAVIDAGNQAGARKTYLIEEPIAAALGAGVDIFSPTGHMIVDIGGGTTDVAVISLGGIVVSKSVNAAGNQFDAAIMKYMRRRHNVIIGERTAEMIKVRIGAVYEHSPAQEMVVKGRCLLQGLPKEVTVSSKEMLEAMIEPITEVLDAIYSVIENTPPELIGDILKGGILLTGGGSQLYGIDKLITEITKIKTRVVEHPELCVVKGTGRALEYLDNMPEGIVDLSKIRPSSRVPAGSRKGSNKT
ncbi:MAG: rod shape-determining protein [Clostridia bacterium]|nr:rod shape-determining protein [Clostridia bacterium]